MTKLPKLLLSVVVPVFNEDDGIETFHSELSAVLKEHFDGKYEIIYCNDGSTDDSLALLKHIAKDDSNIRIISLSRNFGKEIATTAGIHQAKSQAIITLDADGQHPVELIPEFIKRWQAGSKVVVGLRTSNQREGWVKRYGSKIFYKLFNGFTGMKLEPGATDFRLIDYRLQSEFKLMTEHNRITRGLIDWLGYSRDYIPFKAHPRIAGNASYSVAKLAKLALDSFVSLSITPLYATFYLGLFILPSSLILGLLMMVNEIVGDPMQIRATGTAYLSVLILFLVGVILISQGIIGLYVSHIHTETQNRPLYIVDKEQSLGIDE